MLDITVNIGMDIHHVREVFLLHEYSRSRDMNLLESIPNEHPVHNARVHTLLIIMATNTNVAVLLL